MRTRGVWEMAKVRFREVIYWSHRSWRAGLFGTLLAMLRNHLRGESGAGGRCWEMIGNRTRTLRGLGRFLFTDIHSSKLWSGPEESSSILLLHPKTITEFPSSWSLTQLNKVIATARPWIHCTVDSVAHIWAFFKPDVEGGVDFPAHIWALFQNPTSSVGCSDFVDREIDCE